MHKNYPILEWTTIINIFNIINKYYKYLLYFTKNNFVINIIRRHDEIIFLFIVSIQVCYQVGINYRLNIKFFIVIENDNVYSSFFCEYNTLDNKRSTAEVIRRVQRSGMVTTLLPRIRSGRSISGSCQLIRRIGTIVAGICTCIKNHFLFIYYNKSSFY